jgi:DNA-directed RNA polymerase subunit beta'
MVFEAGKLVGEYKAEEDQYGTILVPPVAVNPVIRIVNRTPYLDPYPLAEGYTPSVKSGAFVEVGNAIARPTKASSKPPSTESGEELPERTEILARSPGKVKVTKGHIQIASEEVDIRDHHVTATDSRLVFTGDKVSSGQKLTVGVKDPHDVLRIEGTEPTERYLQEQVQTVYRSQGVTINDKHIEVIVRQMLRWVRVENTGGTDLLPNQLIDRLQFQDVNARIIAEGGEPATSKPEILGVTRASLNTDSFLAKASFQETARVLTEAAILGEVDYLRGLKENVIIGRLIPARLDISEEGRRRLGLPEGAPASVGAHMGAGNGEISAAVLADFSDEPSSLLAELEEGLLGNGGVPLSEAFSEEIANAIDVSEENEESSGGKGEKSEE